MLSFFFCILFDVYLVVSLYVSNIYIIYYYCSSVICLNTFHILIRFFPIIEISILIYCIIIKLISGSPKIFFFVCLITNDQQLIKKDAHIHTFQHSNTRRWCVVAVVLKTILTTTTIMDTAKRCAEDFVFHRIIGEGSFSVVSNFWIQNVFCYQ